MAPLRGGRQRRASPPPFPLLARAPPSRPTGAKDGLQTMSTMIGKKSPLHDWHAANGARFVEFGGWQLPEVYGKSVEQEYATLRNGCALVDLCHEARYRVEGNDSAAFLNELLTVDVAEMDVRMSKFGYLCNQRGGIIDGVTIYRDQNYFLLLGNAPQRYQALDWLEAQSRTKANYEVRVADVTTAQGQLCLMGPGAPAVLERVVFQQKFNLDPGAAALVSVGEARCLVLRRFTDGYDIITGSIYMAALWEKIADVVRNMGSRPVGFAGREILRVESGYPQYGLEIDPETTPLEITQSPAVDFRKPKFIGRRALMHSLSAEFTRALVAVKVEMDRPLEMGAELLADSFPIGRVTSFAISPVLRCKVALAFVSSIRSKPGTAIMLRNRDGQTYRGEITKPGNIAINR